MILATYNETFNTDLIKLDSILNEPNDSKLDFLDGLDGTLSELLEQGVFGGWSKTSGVEFNVDKSSQDSYLQSRNFSQYTTGWRADSDGLISALNMALSGSAALTLYNTSGVVLGRIKSDGLNTAVLIDASTDIQAMLLRTGAATGIFAPNVGTITIGSAAYPWGGATLNGAVDIQSSLQCDSLRVDQTPTVEVNTASHYATVNFNGTNYKVLLKSV